MLDTHITIPINYMNYGISIGNKLSVPLKIPFTDGVVGILSILRAHPMST